MRIMILAVLLCFGSPAGAAEADRVLSNGNWFVRNCQSGSWENECMAYSLGYFQGSQSRRRTVCIPEGVDQGQLWGIALKYMRDHPEKGHLLGMVLMDEAWEDAFPCQR